MMRSPGRGRMPKSCCRARRGRSNSPTSTSTSRRPDSGAERFSTGCRTRRSRTREPRATSGPDPGPATTSFMRCGQPMGTSNSKRRRRSDVVGASSTGLTGFFVRCSASPPTSSASSSASRSSGSSAPGAVCLRFRVRRGYSFDLRLRCLGRMVVDGKRSGNGRGRKTAGGRRSRGHGRAAIPLAAGDRRSPPVSHGPSHAGGRWFDPSCAH